MFDWIDLRYLGIPVEHWAGIKFTFNRLNWSSACQAFFWVVVITSLDRRKTSVSGGKGSVNQKLKGAELRLVSSTVTEIIYPRKPSGEWIQLSEVFQISCSEIICLHILASGNMMLWANIELEKVKLPIHLSQMCTQLPSDCRYESKFWFVRLAVDGCLLERGT